MGIKDQIDHIRIFLKTLTSKSRVSNDVKHFKNGGQITFKHSHKHGHKTEGNLFRGGSRTRLPTHRNSSNSTSSQQKVRLKGNQIAEVIHMKHPEDASSTKKYEGQKIVIRKRPFKTKTNRVISNKFSCQSGIRRDANNDLQRICRENLKGLLEGNHAYKSAFNRSTSNNVLKSAAHNTSLNNKRRHPNARPKNKKAQARSHSPQQEKSEGTSAEHGKSPYLQPPTNRHARSTSDRESDTSSRKFSSGSQKDSGISKKPSSNSTRKISRDGQLDSVVEELEKANYTDIDMKKLILELQMFLDMDKQLEKSIVNALDCDAHCGKLIYNAGADCMGHAHHSDCCINPCHTCGFPVKQDRDSLAAIINSDFPDLFLTGAEGFPACAVMCGLQDSINPPSMNMQEYTSPFSEPLCPPDVVGDLDDCVCCGNLIMPPCLIHY